MNFLVSLFVTGYSEARVILRKGASLEGELQKVDLSIDTDSSWVVTAASSLIRLRNTGNSTPEAFPPRIHDNGHTITYNVGDTANQWLEGKSFSLLDGGMLIPGEVQ